MRQHQHHDSKIRTDMERTRAELPPTTALGSDAAMTAELPPIKELGQVPRNTKLDAQLPHELRGVKSRFNIGTKSYQPQFENDLDKSIIHY